MRIFPHPIAWLGFVMLAGMAVASSPVQVQQLLFALEENAGGNVVVAYRISDAGDIVQSARYVTGSASAGGISHFGSHDLVQSGHILLVPNSGSNTITSFRIEGGRLVRVQEIPSGGLRPVAISEVRVLGEPAYNYGRPGPKQLPGAAGSRSEGIGLFYVLNHVGNMVQGFTVDETGKLDRVEHSTRLLGCGLLGKGARLNFSLDGGRLVATDRYSENRSAFYVLPDGTLSEQKPVVHQATLLIPEVPSSKG